MCDTNWNFRLKFGKRLKLKWNKNIEDFFFSKLYFNENVIKRGIISVSVFLFNKRYKL